MLCYIMFQVHSEGYKEPKRKNKCIILIQNGHPQRMFKFQFNNQTNRQQIIKVVQKNWGIGKYRFIKLFTIDGIEYFDEDLLYLKDADRLYVSKGQQFDSNKNFGEYQIVRKLGEGGFGYVELARNIITGEYAAIKILKPDRNTSSTDIDMIFRQAENLKALNHPNIVKIINCYALSDMKVIMVMEYLEGGQLLTLLHRKKTFQQQQARIFFKQIIQAVCYCHRNGIIHRDLKLQNILLNRDGVAKVADFGISGVADRFNPQADWGTLKYMAPQVLSGKQKKNSTSVDVWACGIILFYMVYGYLPFTGSSTPQIIRQVVKQPLKFSDKIYVSNKCKKLIQKMLCKNPDDRLSIAQVEDDPWTMYGDIPTSSLLKTNPSEENVPRINQIKKSQRKSINLNKNRINIKIPKRLEKERDELEKQLRHCKLPKKTLNMEYRFFPDVRSKKKYEIPFRKKAVFKTQLQENKK